MDAKIQNENGYIVAETVGVFVPFIFFVISILSLVNIVTVQARVHFALTQAAQTLSVYCYTFEVIGIASDLTALDNKASTVTRDVILFKNDIDELLTEIEDLSDIVPKISSAYNLTKRVYGIGEEIVTNPKSLFQRLLNYGVNELRNAVFEEIARPVTGRYLGTETMTGDEYLTKAGVVNSHTKTTGLAALEFHKFNNIGLGNSVLIDKNGNVKLTVEYEILYTFATLPLPFTPTLHITQTVNTKAWLNGSGMGYW